MKKVLVYICILVLLLLAACSFEQNVTSSPTNLTTIHDLENGQFITYSQDSQTIWLFSFNQSLEVIASTKALGNVWKATRYNDNIVIGYGYGRGMLDNPVQIVMYDSNLQNEVVLFTVPSSRSQITELRQLNQDLFISYFDSKYFTVLGLLERNNSWKFSQQDRIRLATEFDFDKDAMIIGRPYGDEIGIDGDITLYANNTQTKLPSFRGVSAIKFAQLDNDTPQEILIADGWHQNYGELAQPRLTLLDLNGTTYVDRLIGSALPQYAINRIYPILHNNDHYIITVGNSHVDVFSLQRQRQTMYTTQNPFFDAVYLGKNKTHAFIAVLDNNIIVKSMLLS